MRPPVPYFGGKQTIAPWIVSLLPDHQHYIEPYCGSLSVLLAKPPSHAETVNDMDGELMTFWRVLRDRPNDLVRVCELTPASRADFEAAFEPCADDLEVARRVWARLAQGRSSRLTRTGWRHILDPAGKTLPLPGYLNGYRERLLPAAERIANVSLECLPALDVIAKYGRSPLNLLYIDPPYAGSARARGYRHEMQDDDEHRDLASALAGCRAAVVLSGYHSPLYDELYAGWHVYELSTTTNNGTGDTARTEVLWANRPLGSQLGLFDPAA